MMQNRRPRRAESLEDMVARRNKRLKRLFTENGFDIRLVGDEQKPAVILDEKIVLSCFAKNFDLYFTKEPFSDDIVLHVKLTKEITVNQYDIQQAIDASVHRQIYKIKLMDTDLFLVGYNYLNQEDSVGRYPVFARHKPKVYFSYEKAEEIFKLLEQDNYTIEII